MSSIRITPFDNEISIAYKWAELFRIPVSLILVLSEIVDNKEVIVYKNSLVEIPKSIEEGLNLDQIHSRFGEKLDTEDIAMIYYLYTRNRKDPSTILDEINRLYESEGIQEILSLEDLSDELNTWNLNIREEYRDVLKSLNELQKNQEELVKYSEVPYSPFKMNQVTIRASPVLKNTNLPPNIDDGIIMFDKAIPSYDVPYIRYNGKDNGKRLELFKLYRGTTDEDIPDYKIIIPPTSQTNKNNSFYFTVWTGKSSKTTKESYIKGYYNIEENLLIIKTPAEENIIKSSIIQKIEQALYIKIEDIIETGVSGDFFLYDLDINDIYLVDMIINTDLMSSYLFVKETNTPYAEKRQLKVYYKSFGGEEDEENKSEGYIVNPSSVSASLTQNKYQGESLVLSTEEGPTKYRLAYNTPYVKVKITQAKSMDVADQFIKIFSRLMGFYKQNKGSVERLFLQFIPELTSTSKKPTEITVKQTSTRKGPGDSKIERLKEAAPEMFVNGYARKCQCALQPIIIQDDEIEAWRNKTFVHKEATRYRQIMSFPPNNPKWHFVCPSDLAPYPGVKINKDLPNKEDYPCLPCCFKDDQMDPTVNSNYNECFRKKSKEPEETKFLTKVGHKIKTDKILAPGGYGFLPRTIEELLKKYISNPDSNVSRMGIPRSTNSLLHCISVALQDPNYLELQTIKDKENYVNRIREFVTTQTVANLMKQEMYDFTDEEIKRRLSDNNIFLDPNLFYRAVEQVYNINIYVFSPPLSGAKDSLGSMEIPRFKLFHSRSPRPEKRAILIFRTWGAESDSLDYPQCELIVERNEENNTNITNFGSELNNILHNALITLNRTITWELKRTGKETKGIVARENIYSRINYFDLFNRVANKQIIDGYGKCRAFILPINGIDMTVIIPSTQPENLPTGKITRVGVEMVTNILGEPTAVTKDNGMVNGLWYQVLDIEYGIYVPVNPTNSYENKKIGPNNPLIEEDVDIIYRLRKIKRDLEIILQIIIWLFLLSKMDVANFINRYFIIGREDVSDSAKVYDFSKVGLQFPVVSTVEEGINKMRDLSPTLFGYGGEYLDRIYLYSQKFYEGILYYLQKYNKERKPLEPKIPTIIYRSDTNEEDFTPQRRVAIFTDEGDMKTWINSLDKLSFKNIIIEDKLNIGNALRTEPYLYSSQTGKIYMIQNVIGGNKLKAIRVAYDWYLYKINGGYKSPEFEDEIIPVYVAYGISPALAPIIIENTAGDSTNYLQILSYGSDRYAAMLPLL